jgi:hypothetical protein
MNYRVQWYYSDIRQWIDSNSFVFLKFAIKYATRRAYECSIHNYHELAMECSETNWRVKLIKNNKIVFETKSKYFGKRLDKAPI